jgi:hypothetical protein
MLGTILTMRVISGDYNLSRIAGVSEAGACRRNPERKRRIMLETVRQCESLAGTLTSVAHFAKVGGAMLTK